MSAYCNDFFSAETGDPVNKMNLPKTASFLILLLISFHSRGQGGTTIRASADKNRILIGEPLSLTVEQNFPRGIAPVRLLIDSIPHFEFLGAPVTDSLNDNGNTILKTVYTITSFDSGHQVIPAFTAGSHLTTDTLPVDVLFSDFDPQQDYHDIKDIIDSKLSRKNNTWWYVAGGALLLLILLYFLLRKKKPAPAAIPLMPANPFAEAMRELEKLQKESPGAKQFHSRLTDIFRNYILQRKGILSMQKTTEDLVLQVKGMFPDIEAYHQLSQALRLSDFVKFAKYAPTGDDNQMAFDTIKRSIGILEKSADVV